MLFGDHVSRSDVVIVWDWIIFGKIIEKRKRHNFHSIEKQVLRPVFLWLFINWFFTNLSYQCKSTVTLKHLGLWRTNLLEQLLYFLGKIPWPSYRYIAKIKSWITNTSDNIHRDILEQHISRRSLITKTASGAVALTLASTLTAVTTTIIILAK